MKRYKLTIQYDGTEYCGWQKQKNGVSVQEVLTSALGEIAEGEVKITGSGRTDSGVHARGQVAHVDMTTTVPHDKIALAINPRLPKDIAIINSCEVPASFHARYGAKRKTYEYRTYVSNVTLPLLDRYALRLDKAPDLNLIKKCAKLFVGEHDFKAFMSTGSSVIDTVRTIYDLTVDGEEEIVFKVTGNGFLYNMVRIIVGTLLDVGYCKKTIDEVKMAIEEGDRGLAGRTVPAHGLTLHSVIYEE